MYGKKSLYILRGRARIRVPFQLKSDTSWIWDLFLEYWDQQLFLECGCLVYFDRQCELNHVQERSFEFSKKKKNVQAYSGEEIKFGAVCTAGPFKI